MSADAATSAKQAIGLIAGKVFGVSPLSFCEPNYLQHTRLARTASELSPRDNLEFRAPVLVSV
jgi:hypothetical protein